MKYLALTLLLITSLFADLSLTPDGNWVEGQPTLTPDGNYVGSSSEEVQLTPDGNYIGVYELPSSDSNNYNSNKDDHNRYNALTSQPYQH